MRVDVRTEYAGLPIGRPFTLRLLVEIFGDAPSAARKPLNLSLVLDRSGSMAGSKLACALEAVRHVAGELTEADRCSLTIFDDEVTTLFTACAGGDMKTVETALAGVTPGGCTNLFGGYQNAGGLAVDTEAGGRLSRVMMFTDGLANRGEVRPEVFVRAATTFRDSGASTTTIGFGEDYDEHLLSAIAEAGGGNPYHVEAPEEIVDVFREELGSLRDLSRTNCTVRFRPGMANSFTVTQLTGCREDASGAIVVGDIPADGRRLVILEMAMPPAQGFGTFELGRVTVSSDPADGADAAPAPPRIITVHMELMPEEDFNRLERDTEVAVEAALAVAAKIRKESWRLSRDGRHREAAAYLLDKASALESLGLSDGRLLAVIDELRGLAETIRREGELSRRQQKRLYNTSELTGKGRYEQFDRMAERRNRYSSDE